MLAERRRRAPHPARRGRQPRHDAVFVSEVRLALFLLPALFAGVGINLISHVLIRHLQKAEAQFETEHPERTGARPRAD